MTERPAQINLGIWIEIVHNLRCMLDSRKGNTHQAELKRLEFHAILDIGIFYRRLFDKVEWFYSLAQSIYLSQWLEFRKIHGIYGICILYVLPYDVF